MNLLENGMLKKRFPRLGVHELWIGIFLRNIIIVCWPPRRSQKLFQAKYMAYMPTPEVLKKEIEKQKEIFWLDERKMSLSDMRAEYSCRNA
nr:hypothetical protein [Fibrobacter succinogenes]